MQGPQRLLVVYGVLALATVGLGCLICALADVPTSIWMRNLIGWGVGLAAAGAIAAFAGKRTATVLLGLSAVLVAASLFGPAQQGVHRWLAVGPLSINLALLMLPMAVVALDWTRERASSWGLALAILGLLVVQPDASQATAFAGALALIVLRAPLSTPVRVGLITMAAGLAAFSWLRPDPLAPVPEVEEIIALAWAETPVLAVAAVVLIVATSLGPILGTRPAGARPSGIAAPLSAYLLLTAGMTLFGAFPMPLLGIGMSPIVGFWLGVGLLAAQLRRGPSPASGS
jgi:cell division protein FtsW (lipid II flippase)